MHHLSVSWRIIPLKFLTETYALDNKSPSIYIQFFKLLIALMKVHVISHTSFETARSRFIQILHRFVVSKITRIWWILIQALKTLQNLYFNGLLLTKIYNAWDKKVQRSYFMTLKSHAKFEEKLTCGLENDMRNLANFHQNTWKCKNWYFHGILLSKVENVWA